MERPVDRQFYSLDSNGVNKSHFHVPSDTEKENLVDYVAQSIIGTDKTFCGPFGLRKAVYLDYTASGRALSFIEDYIQNEVLPEYGNTHTTTSVTSLQTTMFRHEARDIIRNAVNASEHDSVIFTGSGSTGAIHKLIHAINLSEPPVVFIGPFEHHSNLLPWSEKGAEVVTIKQTPTGLVDISHLEQQLQAWAGNSRQLIGSFSAASNVTGILCDVDAISVLLHKYGALVFWDYATAAPYVKLDMNPVVPGKNSGFAYKDAMFISPHKFVGGVSTPGVLVVKKKVFHNTVPDECGGGTVFYVRREARRYLREPELREEGGTPNIVGAIRAGMVFQLKSAVTPELIMQKEHDLFRQAVEAWRSVPNLVILGNVEVDRLPIFSFLVHNPSSGLFLHHNYVSALLNDLFGVQARGGCACAGPYAMDLLGLAEEKAKEIEELLAEDGRLDRVHLRRYMEYSHREIIRPGFTRLNLPYFISQDELNFVLQAVAMVAEHGWKLLPQYMFNPETGEWRHKEHQVFRERKWLGHISYGGGHMQYSLPKVNPKGPLPRSFQECLNMARQHISKAEKSRPKLADHTAMFDEEARPYRWFLLPSEASQLLSDSSAVVHHHVSSLPFCPPELHDKLENTQQGDLGFGSGGVKGSVVRAGGDSLDVMNSGGGDGGGVGKEMKTANDQRVTGDNVEKRVNCHSNRETGCGTQTEDDTGVHVEAQSLTDPVDSLSQEVKESLHVHGGCATQQQHSTHSSEAVELVAESKANCDTFPQALQTAMERGYSDGISDVHVSQMSPGYEIRRPYPPVPVRTGIQLHEETGSATNKVSTVSDSQTVKSGQSVSASDSVQSNSQFFSSTFAKTQPQSAKCIPDKAESDGAGAKAASSATKPKKKKKKKKASNGDKCTENGTCDPAKPQAESGKKEGESGSRWVPPTKDIFKPTVKALEEFSMLEDGDRVLVCLSGGKDSLSLLHTMHQYQFYCRSKEIQFELGAVTVDPQTPSYDPSPLKEYLAVLGVPYFYESQCIMETAVNLPNGCASICSFCSRMKRGRIYAAARRGGYNVLALGQHLDDLAESFIMSLFHNGSLRTMKAHYTVQEGDLRVIRPFVNVREKDLRNFAEKNKLPVIADNCPACFEAPKERHRTKQLLASQEILFPHLYSSILSAIKPVMAMSRTGTSTASLLAATDTADDLDI
ncbi:uncharacterized protein [Littorina saxatilis]|uniref:Uncharacterized protein n=1 Tax=Littorina saxatilis TaxID=31220 RepID=A0AAN9G6S7_9CAEN